MEPVRRCTLRDLVALVLCGACPMDCGGSSPSVPTNILRFDFKFRYKIGEIEIGLKLLTRSDAAVSNRGPFSWKKTRLK